MPSSTVCRLLTGLLLIFCSSVSFAQTPVSPAPRDTLKELADAERQRTKDPALDSVPYNRLAEARFQLAQQQATGAPPATQSIIPNLTWQERGPSNAGGRTRALLFDPNDPTHKKVWAGSVSGGLWYTTDITSAAVGWTPVSDSWESLVVTALAADPTNPQVMYAGTGNIYNYQIGGGIWKTTDGGATWARLSSTIPGGNLPAISTAFEYVQRIVINTTGQVFAATQYGIVKSGDGGTTWQYALAPNQGVGMGGASTGLYGNDKATDLEIGTDGILYASFHPSRVFRSNDATGTAWTEITPPGALGGERTELALAPSTSGAGQVLYGVSRMYNSASFGQDIKWFRKSTNGGATWTDIAIPTYVGNTHFTYGNGYYSLSLAVHPADPNILYAGGADWFRSTDGGTSWSSRLANVGIAQQALVFQPGNAQSAVFCSDRGVYWSANWNDTALAQPTILDKNDGYRVGEVNAVAMKASAGSPYLLGTSRNGAFKLTTDGVSAGSFFYSSSYDMGPTFIDEDQPSLQVFISSGGTIYTYDGASGYQFVGGIGVGTGVADYDSQSNTLYVSDYAGGSYTIRKLTGIGSTPTSTQLPLTGLTTSPSFITLNKDRTALFIGTYPGKLYKVTNLNQPTPTLTAINNGAFQQYTTISCIDVGADDNELLVTLSNYGVQSVWYTNNGGGTWVGKDQSNYGLPDVPVRAALFNPQNRRQVLLGTDLGIWSTTDIGAPDPGWGFSGTGMGTYRINQLRYRASDGRVAAATTGRGVFTSDVFAIPFTPSTITLTGVSTSSLCAGSVVSVSFSTTGPAFANNPTVEIWLSDAAGGFSSQRKVGSGTTSPISVTLPGGSNPLSYGTNYRFKAIAPGPDLTSGASDALAIGDLATATVTDRRGNGTNAFAGATICPNSRAIITAFPHTGTNALTTADSYQWTLDGTPITGATSQTVSAQQAGTYQATVRQAGCTLQSYSYQLATSTSPFADVRSATSDLPQCDNNPVIISSGYVGETATYQWTRNGTDIAGATSLSVSASQSGSYSFRLADGTCTATARPLQLSIGRSLYARILRYPDTDSLLCTGSYSPIYLYTEQISSDQIAAGTYSIQWYRDNQPLSGTDATRNYYYATQPGNYFIELRQGSCTTRSNAFVIGEGAIVAPKIEYAYHSKTACPGETRSLFVASVTGNYSYQWQKNGIDIPGATSNSYAAGSSGTYTIRLTKGACQATSLPLSLTFSTTIQPTVYFYGPSAESCSGIYLYANDLYQLTGYQYQWFRDGTAIGGATGSNLIAQSSGAYSIQVSNGACTGLSKRTYVQTGKLSKPVIAPNQPLNEVCGNNSCFG